MKLKFYMDVFPGWDPKYAIAYSSINWQKADNGKRIAFEVEIPDYILNPVDFQVPETSVAKEVK